MGVHGHGQAARGGQRELTVALCLTLVMMVIEMIVGWTSGSLALVADAGHMLADASMLTLSLFAARYATRPANLEKTYGYYRMEILAALANGLALCIIVIWIYIKAIGRLHHPSGIATAPMISIALLGLAVNLLSGWILMNKRSGSLNVQGAWLNVMSDALGSLGVVIAGLAIHWHGWIAADPIASMVIGILIAANSWKLVKQSVNILLEATPGHLQIPEVVQAMQAVPGVSDVHDVHLWTITTGMDAVSGHVIVDDVAHSEAILSQLNTVLSQQFGIVHTTFQLEPQSHICQMSRG